MKSKQNRGNTSRIILVTLLAASVTIALFIVFIVGSGVIMPSTPAPSSINKVTDKIESNQKNLNNSGASSSSPPPTEVSSPNSTEIYGEPRSQHDHASIAVFINGNPLNFSHPKFQNQDLLMHFEGGNSFTLHKHAKKSWLGPFFESLNITFAQNCFVIKDNGSSYCSNFDKQISLYVNGEVNNMFQHYVPKDGDKILLSYGGSKKQIDKQLHLLDSIPIAN
jgi:hypothetical protein